MKSIVLIHISSLMEMRFLSSNLASLLFTVFLSVTTVSPTLGAELWVDRDSLGGTCNDNRPRETVTKATPWCTLAKAGNSVVAGDVVRVRAGEYSEPQNCSSCDWIPVLQPVANGTAMAPIRFMPEPGESVLLSASGGAVQGIRLVATDEHVPSFIEFSGFEITGFSEGCVSFVGVNDIVVTDLDVHGCSGPGISATGSSRVTIAGNRVHDNPINKWTSAINLYLCKSGNQILRNRVWSNSDEDYRETEGHGIILDHCEAGGSTIIENNVIWNNEGFCINVFFSDGAIVRNNTCWGNGVGRPWAAELTILGSRAEIFNNILVAREGNLALAIDDSAPPSVDHSTISSDYNLLWSETPGDLVRWPIWTEGTFQEYQQLNSFGWDANSALANPSVLDASNAEFRLSANSPAIDMGSTPDGSIIDHAGFPRPIDGDLDRHARTDPGAFEFGGIFLADFEYGALDPWSAVVP